MSDTCLYMVHFGLGAFSQKVTRNKLHRFTIKENQKKEQVKRNHISMRSSYMLIVVESCRLVNIRTFQIKRT